MQINYELNLIEKTSREIFIRHFPINKELLIVTFAEKSWTIELLYEVKKYSQSKKSKSFYVHKIDVIDNEFFGTYVLKSFVSKNNLHIKDVSGILKIEFSDGNIMLIIKAATYKLNEINWFTLTVSRKDTFVNFSNLIKSFLNKRIAIPLKGKFDVDFIDRYKLEYSELPPCNDPNLIIPHEEYVIKTIDNFYDNIEFYTSGKRKGMWVSLFYGPPGSGKSSFCNKIGDLYSEKALVVFTTNFAEIVEHLKTCARGNIRTIVVWEDADTNIINGNSFSLNFLQGHLTPVNKKGAYVIITTNFNSRIEARVLRPGRVNMKFYFGPLTDEFALQCAQGYFSEQYPEFDEIIKNGDRNELIRIFNNLTGAQIEQIYIITDLNLGPSLEKELTLDAIKKAKESLIEHELRTAKVEQQNLTNGKTIGF